MKKGDTVPVTIAGQVVASATVREVGEGEVTLVVPATLVRMATRTEIAHEVPTESEKETVIVGVDTPEVAESTDGGTPKVEMPEPTPPSENAPVAETPVETVEPPTTPVEQTNPVVTNEE